MDHSRKIQLIVHGGLLWAASMGVTSLAFGLKLSHDLIRRSENGSLIYVVDKDHENIVQWSAWLGFGIAAFTSIVAPCTFWLAQRLRAQVLADYEESNGNPFNDAAGIEYESMATGLARLVLGAALISWFLGSLSIIHRVQHIKKDDTIFIHLSTAAQILSSLMSLVHVGVVWYALEVRRIVRDARAPRPGARVPRPGARAAANGQANQNGIEMRDMRPPAG